MTVPSDDKSPHSHYIPPMPMQIAPTTIQSTTTTRTPSGGLRTRVTPAC